MAGRVLKSRAQRDLILRPERQNSLGRKGPAAGAEPDKLTFDRRRKNQRQNGRRLANLVAGHHLGGETKLERARRLKPARRKQELNCSVFRKRGGGHGENQR